MPQTNCFDCTCDQPSLAKSPGTANRGPASSPPCEAPEDKGIPQCVNRDNWRGELRQQSNEGNADAFPSVSKSIVRLRFLLPAAPAEAGDAETHDRQRGRFWDGRNAE